MTENRKQELEDSGIDWEESKETLQKGLQAQLEEWSAEIDHYRAEAERKEAQEKLRREFYEELQNLRERYNEAAAKVETLAEAGGDALKGLQRDIENTWSNLKKSLSDMRSKLSGS